MKIYISGKISGLREDSYVKNFKAAKLAVHQQEDASWNDIINPVDLKPIFGLRTWLCYMIVDIWHLRKCQMIAMQPNWTDSNGAIIEFLIAKYILRIKVKFIKIEVNI